MVFVLEMHKRLAQNLLLPLSTNKNMISSTLTLLLFATTLTAEAKELWFQSLPSKVSWFGPAWWTRVEAGPTWKMSRIWNLSPKAPIKFYYIHLKNFTPLRWQKHHVPKKLYLGIPLHENQWLCILSCMHRPIQLKSLNWWGEVGNSLIFQHSPSCGGSLMPQTWNRSEQQLFYLIALTRIRTSSTQKLKLMGRGGQFTYIPTECSSVF